MGAVFVILLKGLWPLALRVSFRENRKHAGNNHWRLKCSYTDRCSMPKVSFVTVNYNNHEGLARTLRELKKVKELSRLHDIELIVVDGGSDADDRLVIDQFRDCLDRVISEKDNGIYDAMNKGIGCATGNFVNFMNSGDVPLVLEMVSFIENLDKLNTNTVHCGRGIWSHQVIALFSNTVSAFWLKMPNHQAMFFPLNFHRQNYYNLDYKVAADLDVKIKAFNEIGFTMHGVSLVLCEPGGTSHTIHSLRDLFIRANEIKSIATINNGLLSGYVNFVKFILWHFRRLSF